MKHFKNFPWLIPVICFFLFSCEPMNRNYTPANSNEEWVALVKDPNVNIIRSPDDFRKFAKRNKELRKVFDEDRLELFVKDLRFKEGKLLGFSLKSIIDEPNYVILTGIIAEGFGASNQLQATSWTGECQVDAGVDFCNEFIESSRCTPFCIEL